jgi:hypothetical protein
MGRQQAALERKRLADLEETILTLARLEQYA